MFRVYNVLENDSLDSIANMFNTTIDELKKINDISTIKKDDLIVVPNDDKWYKKYVVMSGDNMYQIANNNNIDLDILMKINGLDKDDYIYPNQEIIIPKANYSLYITKQNDTLKKIIDFLNKDMNKLTSQSDNIIILEDQLIINKK